jgi:phosphoribosylaminoimidazole-succinocarboxamide synthase
MTNLPPVLYRGSVKNVRGEVSGKFLFFEFSDRYSVFDWGEMPDQLEDKGKTLAIMGKSFFQFLGDPQNWKKLFSHSILKQNYSSEYLNSLEHSDLFNKLSKEGLPHHAVLEEDLPSAGLLKVKNVKVIHPHLEGDTYQYASYADKPIDALVPLEVIFRLGLSAGNSLTKRLGQDLVKWKSFGFENIPAHDFKGLLKKPFVDFSTKLEASDRYLDYKEARLISGMNEAEFEELKVMTELIALNLFCFHHELGLELWDGKIEVAFIPGVNGNRSFMLVDSIGIDELRLLYKGKSFSKEFLRENYKNSYWYEYLELSKKESPKNFKKICQEKYHSNPSALDGEVLERAVAVYKSYANAVTMKIEGKNYFSESFNLDSYNKRYL